VQLPVARVGAVCVVRVPGVILILAFAESQLKVAETLLASALPLLHTWAPTMKVFGPADRLLLSRPNTPQEAGVIVRMGAPDTMKTGASKTLDNNASAASRMRTALDLVFNWPFLQ